MTDISGAFKGYRLGSTEFTFDETTVLEPHGDTTYDHYLAPSDNVVKNGSFEQMPSAADWSISNTSTISRVETVKHHGQFSIRLGIDCGYPCLESTQLDLIDPDPNERIEAQQMMLDQYDNLHLWGINSQALPMYQVRAKDGHWGNPIVLASISAQSPVAGFIDLSGTAHALWSMFPSSGTGPIQVYHASSNPDGTWSNPEAIGNGYYVRAFTDTAGKTHVVYNYTATCAEAICSESGLYYTSINQSGEWQTPRQIWTSRIFGLTVTDFVIGINGTDQINVIFLDRIDPTSTELNLYEIDINQASEISAPYSLHLIGSPRPQQIVRDSFGNQFMLAVDINFSLNESRLYIKPVHGEWKSEPIWIGAKKGSILSIDAANNLYIIGDDADFYITRSSDGKWSEPTDFHQNELITWFDFIRAAAIGSGGEINLLKQRGNYYILSSKAATESTTSEIQQTVAISSQLHSPTLSFMYTLVGPSTHQTYFDVVVSDGITNSQLFSTSTSTPWKLAWANLSPWLGKHVTVTFTLHQAPEEMIKTLYLDNISVGSWLTALPKSVLPNHIDVNEAPQIIVSGDNFVATPEVRLGDDELTNVQWLDEHHIAITPPIELAPGGYDLFVINPGGNQSVLPSALWVGKQLYLPVINR